MAMPGYTGFLGGVTRLLGVLAAVSMGCDDGGPVSHQFYMWGKTTIINVIWQVGNNIWEAADDKLPESEEPIRRW